MGDFTYFHRERCKILKFVNGFPGMLLVIFSVIVVVITSFTLTEPVIT